MFISVQGYKMLMSFNQFKNGQENVTEKHHAGQPIEYSILTLESD